MPEGFVRGRDASPRRPSFPPTTAGGRLGERQDDLAILVPLVGAAQQIADAPDEAGDLGMGFSSHVLQGHN